MDKVIGIDVGGTKTIHLVISKGHIGKATFHITPRSRRAFFGLMENLHSLAQADNIKKIGIAIAGKVSKTKFIFGTNIQHLGKIDFATIFEKNNVKVVNDAEAWALAESRLGAGRSYSKVLMLTIGTGIGRAVCVRGKKTNRIPFLPYEKWEKQYQQIRDTKNWRQLCNFLGPRLAFIIDKVHPNVVVISGGVLKAQSEKFAINLKKSIRNTGCKTPIKKARFGDSGAAIGATLLFA